MAWWICCDNNGGCYTALGDEGICEQQGSTTFGPGTTCRGVDCNAFLSEEVSCCITVGQNVECHALTLGECNAAGGVAEMPAGCGPTISCGGLAEGACCVDGECIPETQTECDDDGGVFHSGLTCEQVVCQPELIEEGCRDERPPRYDPGVKAHSLDLCETVVLADVLHRSVGGADLGGDVQPGYVTPVTVHEVRAVKTGTADQCRFYVGKFFMGHDGYVRPYLCSNPEGGEGRYNVGFGFEQRIRDVEHGGRRVGYVYDAVGIEPPRWNEIVYRDNPVLCSGPVQPDPPR